MIIDMEAIMTNPEARRDLQNFQEHLESLPEIRPLMEAAKSIEDAYEVAKKFVTVKYEIFKQMCMDALGYFAEDKMTLADATLDEVVGGSNWFTECWEKCKGTVITVAVMGVCVVAGAVGGAVIGCGLGGFAGMAAGAAVGTFAGVAVGVGILSAIHYATGIEMG